jgi:hypothetical protein
MPQLRCRSIQPLIAALSLAAACEAPPPLATAFRPNLSEDSADVLDPTPTGFTFEGNILRVRAPRNRVLWLTPKLPRNVEITLEAVAADDVAERATGDFKFVLYGNGGNPPIGAAPGDIEGPGYEVVIGGWSNRFSAITRVGKQPSAGGIRTNHAPGRQIDERSKDALIMCRAEAPTAIVEGNRIYQMRITRIERRVSVAVDGGPYLSWADDQDEAGKQSGHFGISGWLSTYYVGNLTIVPL